MVEELREVRDTLDYSEEESNSFLVEVGTDVLQASINGVCLWLILSQLKE